MKKKDQKAIDLKKLAIMGFTAGLMLQSQNLLADSQQFSQTDYSSHLASGNSCGGHGSCGGSGPSTGSGQQNWRAQSSCGGLQPQQQNWQAQGGCGGHQPQQQNWQAQGGCGGRQAQPQNWQAQGGCGGHQPQQQNWQAQGGCGGRQAQPQNWQAQGSCGANSQRNNQSTYADNVKPDQQQSDQMKELFKDGGSTSGGSTNSGSSSAGRNSDYSLAEVDNPSAKAVKMSDKELMDHLNAQGKAAFQSLSPEGKALALKMANQSCKCQNDCKGLNACKTSSNDCAGKGGCKGQSPAAFADKNVAVKVAAAKMAEKRNGVLNKAK